MTATLHDSDFVNKMQPIKTNKYRGLAPMDLSISAMLGTCPDTLISYALFSLAFMLMLHTIKYLIFCFHDHALLNNILLSYFTKHNMKSLTHHRNCKTCLFSQSHKTFSKAHKSSSTSYLKII
jgi:hypothetical protein